MKIKQLPLIFTLLLFLAYLVPEVLAKEEGKIYAIWGDPVKGRKVYAEKGCGKCHAINGVGPTIGPDMAKTSKTPKTITQMAGVMWNHAPEMRKVAREKGVKWESFQGSEMRDLIAFVYFLRLLDKPGDVRRGERLFDEKNCSTCHAVAGQGSKIASDLSKWKQYGSPILWAEIMWQHALEMQEKMQKMGLRWPRFKDNEMVDLIAFIQSKTSKE